MLINKIKRTGICLFVLCFFCIFFFVCEVVYASMLADFEDGTLNTGTGGYFQEYENDGTHGPDYQEVDVDSTQGAGATGSCLKDTVTEGNIYIIYYASGSSRPLISQASGANRLTFYMKLSENYPLGSDYNFHVGTYSRDPINGDPYQLGSHYYHLLNIPGSSYWTKVICNAHPNHQTGVRTDPGDNPQSWNYYDGFTRFYLDMVPQSPIPLPWSGYFDEVRFYTTSEPENDETINNIACSYFGHGHFLISWHGNSQYIHNGHRYEVRYSMSPITNANYSSAAQCPGGPFSLATGSYNWIKADFTISVQDCTRYYFAIKDLDSSSPYVSKIDYKTGTEPPSAPANLIIFQ